MRENHAGQIHEKNIPLQEGDDKYHLLINKMLNGYALHENICNDQGHPIDYRFLEVNQAFERMTGLKAESIIGQTVLEVLPQNGPDWIEKYGKVALSDESSHFELYHRQTDRYFEVMAYRTAFSQFACSFTDTTERKQTELYHNLSVEALAILNDSTDFRDSIQRILTAVKQTTACDATGMRLQAGEDFPYFLQNGFSSDFLLTENTLIERDSNGGLCRNPDGKVKLECTCGLVISGMTDESNPLFTKGGSCWTNDSLPLLDILAKNDPRNNPRNQCIHKGYASVALVPIRTKDRIVGLLQINGHKKGIFTLDAIHALEGIASHIGEAIMRKQAEDVLEASRLNRQIINNAQQGIIVYDRDLRFLVFNPFMEKLTGVPATNVIGRHTFEIFPELLDCGVIERLEKSLAGKTLETAEFSYTNPKTGRIVWRIDTNALLHNTKGEIIGIVTTVQDITERKQAETEKEKLQVQLNQAQKMEAVGRLAGGVAHDFNNMLSVILGYTELALGQIDPSESLHDDLHEVLSAGKRSTDIVRQLLAFASKQTIAPQVLVLNETVESMLKMLRHLIGEDIDLVWSPSAGSEKVKIDPSQLDQLLANLCVNARDAIKGVGKVTIETDKVTFDEDYCADHAGFNPGEFVLLAVSDDGCGMDKETEEQIFEPFFTTKAAGRGTGLGLATIYGAVKQNNGFINVYSEPGHGTTFKIYLPIQESDSEDILKKPTIATSSSHGEIILIVEDEIVVLKLGKSILEKLGYTVLTACNPGDAIQLAEAHTGKIELLISDVVMPEMNGHDLAKQIHTLYPDIKTLFMSGYTANVITHRGMLDKDVCFINKPFSIRDIAAKVREVLESE
jgi:PAS domain S-box-containing protein